MNSNLITLKPDTLQGLSNSIYSLDILVIEYRILMHAGDKQNQILLEPND